MKQSKYKKIGRFRISITVASISFFNEVGQSVRVWTTPYFTYHCNRGTHNVGLGGLNGEICVSIFVTEKGAA